MINVIRGQWNFCEVLQRLVSLSDLFTYKGNFIESKAPMEEQLFSLETDFVNYLLRIYIGRRFHHKSMTNTFSILNVFVFTQNVRSKRSNLVQRPDESQQYNTYNVNSILYSAIFISYLH